MPQTVALSIRLFTNRGIHANVINKGLLFSREPYVQSMCSCVGGQNAQYPK